MTATDGTIAYYCTMTSPWTYLGHEPFVGMCARRGIAIDIRPVDFGSIFAMSGGLPLPRRAPQRRAYRLVELQRWRALRGAELNLHPKHFPVPVDKANCMVVAARNAGEDAVALAGALLRSVWAEERNIADDSDLVAVADAAGFDGTRLLKEAEGADALGFYDALTEQAKSAGVFGAPTYIWRDEPFWGQDRLEFVERAVAGKTAPITPPVEA